MPASTTMLTCATTSHDRTSRATRRCRLAPTVHVRSPLPHMSVLVLRQTADVASNVPEPVRQPRCHRSARRCGETSGVDVFSNGRLPSTRTSSKVNVVPRPKFSVVPLHDLDADLEVPEEPPPRVPLHHADRDPPARRSHPRYRMRCPRAPWIRSARTSAIDSPSVTGSTKHRDPPVQVLGYEH